MAQPAMSFLDFKKGLCKTRRIGKERTMKQKNDSLLPKKVKVEEQEYHKYNKSPLPGSLA